MANSANGRATESAPRRANPVAAGSADKTTSASNGGQAGASSRKSYAPYTAHATVVGSAQMTSRSNSLRPGIASWNERTPTPRKTAVPSAAAAAPTECSEPTVTSARWEAIQGPSQLQTSATGTP